MLRPSSTGTSRPRTTDRLGVRVRSPINGSGMRHVTGRDYVNSICSVPRGCLHIYLLIYDLKCMNWRSSASMTQHRLASVLNSRSIRNFDATSARWYNFKRLLQNNFLCVTGEPIHNFGRVLEIVSFKESFKILPTYVWPDFNFSSEIREKHFTRRLKFHSHEDFCILIVFKVKLTKLSSGENVFNSQGQI